MESLVLAIIGCTFTILATLIGVAFKAGSRLTRVETLLAPLVTLPERVVKLEAKAEALLDFAHVPTRP